MNTKASFLTVVDAYAGYCQICQEPRVVGRIAVTGWLHSGLACSRCLSQLADEVPSDEGARSPMKRARWRPWRPALAATAIGW